MTDSLTQSDIDRIYGRIQKDIDLKEVTNKREFSREIKNNPKTKKWSKPLNDFFWDVYTFKGKIHKKERIIIQVPKSTKQMAYSRGRSERWSDYELRYLQRLRLDGLNVNQISNQLFRTRSSIYTKLSRIKKGGRK
jgi:hypothetical protein